ncbi:MAG: glycerol-3-phosphate 1-O-acyltransferase PlsY [Candidatus Obscuribacterales bacterium]|nr:glycerol-3-phosphate 1-O-acyltransferase PlsY [Candidatus Obscuribacterales bacterium]
MLVAFLACLLSYVVGSIPTGYWLVKILKGVDIRTVGSGSTGATNVLRAAGKPAALFVFFFDIFKGWLAVTIGLYAQQALIDNPALPPDQLLGADHTLIKYALIPAVCGLLSVLGHSKSVFLKFGGGKSAATALGCLVGMNYMSAAGTFGVWLLLLFTTRIVSVASIAAGLAAGPSMWIAGGYPSFVVYAFAAGSYVVIRHRANMKRLMEGTEPKLGQKKREKNEDTEVKEQNGGAKNLLTLAICVLLAGNAAADAAPAGSAQVKPKPPSRIATTPKVQPPIVLSPEESTNIRVYKAASKAVVNITAISSSESFIYGAAPSATETGSGSILTPDGYVLTNNHVIGEAKMVKVTLYDGSAFPARLVGTDPDNDIAVLKIDPQGRTLSTIKLGDSSRLEVGRRVYAIGNPFGLDLTMTCGIISSVGRTLRTDTGRLIKGVLQTDAAINPGNSGGPLLDNQGVMVGVTTAILSKSGQSAGIGFAIPINIVSRIVPQLIQFHAVIRPDHGILAVRPVEFGGGSGLMIAKLDPDGPAAIAGLKGPEIKVARNAGFTMYQVDNSAADIIVKVDSVRVQSVDDLLSYIETKKPGQVVTLNVLNKGKLRQVQVKLAPGAAAP